MKHLLLSFVLLLSLAGIAQDKQEKKLKVLLLGCFHFDNPGLDVAKFKSADIMSPSRQKEVTEVANLLEQFAPDKIFVESVTSRQPQLDSLFALYRSGKKAAGPSEVEQLGFRVASKLGQTSVYGVDYRDAAFPFDSLMKSATEAGQTDIINFIQKTIGDVQASFNEALQKSTIRQLLLRENGDYLTKLQHRFYFSLLRAGTAANHVGSYLVSEWWRRNMVIYENILKQLDGKEKKIMVIFGSGHTAVLNELMKLNPEIQLVPASQVLKGNVK